VSPHFPFLPETLHSRFYVLFHPPIIAQIIGGVGGVGGIGGIGGVPYLNLKDEECCWTIIRKHLKDCTEIIISFGIEFSSCVSLILINCGFDILYFLLPC
jgi:hypothetical protein